MWCRPVRNCDSVFCTEHPHMVPVLFCFSSQLKIPLLLGCGFQSVKWRILGYVNSKCSFPYVLCCRGPWLTSWSLISLTEKNIPHSGGIQLFLHIWLNWHISISDYYRENSWPGNIFVLWPWGLDLIFLAFLKTKCSKCQQSLLNSLRINSPSRVVSSEVHPHYC